MTEREKQIQEENANRKQVFEALRDRHRENGLLCLRDDEAAILIRWIGDLAAERIIKMVPAEYEGDARSSWWYVCGECHGAIDTNDHYCRHCGSEIDWSGSRL